MYNMVNGSFNEANVTISSVSHYGALGLLLLSSFRWKILTARLLCRIFSAFRTLDSRAGLVGSAP